MPLVSDWGGENSNAYISLTDANTFILESVIDSSAWTDASSMQQTAALIEATRDIDSKQYIGERYFTTQKLELPRMFSNRNWQWNRTLVGTPSQDVDQVRLKQAVEQATCFQALWLLRNSGRNYHLERQAQGVKQFSESVGPISESATYGGSSLERICPDALAPLSPYLESKRIIRG